MQKLFDNYFKYLADNPGHIESIILWHISTFVVWRIMYMYRERMIEGSAGKDGKWQAPESWGYTVLWMTVPIVHYSVFFMLEIPLYDWIFIGVIATYTIIGRWGFVWLLAFRAGKTTVEDSPTTATNENVENKIAS